MKPIEHLDPISFKAGNTQFGYTPESIIITQRCELPEIILTKEAEVDAFVIGRQLGIKEGMEYKERNIFNKLKRLIDEA